jgi:hypothetical protein
VHPGAGPPGGCASAMCGLSATLCTVELLPDGSRTKLILTDQSVFFDGRETPADRSSGWRKVLDRLNVHVSSADTKA